MTLFLHFMVLSERIIALVTTRYACVPLFRLIEAVTTNLMAALSCSCLVPPAFPTKRIRAYRRRARLRGNHRAEVRPDRYGRIYPPAVLRRANEFTPTPAISVGANSFAIDAAASPPIANEFAPDMDCITTICSKRLFLAQILSDPEDFMGCLHLVAMQPMGSNRQHSHR